MNLPLSYLDAKELEGILHEAICDAFARAAAWRAIKPPPEFDASSAPAPPWPDPPPERYAGKMVQQEVAMILYRFACRHGLYAVGTESILLAALDRADAELEAATGTKPPRAPVIEAMIKELAR